MQVSRMPFFTKLMTGGHGRENQQKPDLTTVVHSVSQIARGFSKEQSRKLNVRILQISSGARHSRYTFKSQKILFDFDHEV